MFLRQAKASLGVFQRHRRLALKGVKDARVVTNVRVGVRMFDRVRALMSGEDQRMSLVDVAEKPERPTT